MGLVSGVVVFICIWCVVLFCTLPIGVKPHEEEGLGTAGSAPENPNLKFKFLLTTGISMVIWIITYVIIEMELVSFLEIAEQMHQQNTKNDQ